MRLPFRPGMLEATPERLSDLGESHVKLPADGLRLEGSAGETTGCLKQHEIRTSVTRWK
jgi:hypothetical protein